MDVLVNHSCLGSLGTEAEPPRSQEFAMSKKRPRSSTRPGDRLRDGTLVKPGLPLIPPSAAPENETTRCNGSAITHVDHDLLGVWDADEIYGGGICPEGHPRIRKARAGSTSLYLPEDVPIAATMVRRGNVMNFTLHLGD
jgi:hypothetical protein